VYTDRAMTESSGALGADGSDALGEDFIEDELPFAFADAEAAQPGQRDPRASGGTGNSDAAKALRAGRTAETPALPPATTNPRGLHRVAPNEPPTGSRLPVRHAAARPEQEDPDLTAIAAAVFGPRASTPSHVQAQQAQAQVQGHTQVQDESPGQP
ncbi:MAG: hypothetical protein ACRDSS_12295, partial [Actinocrinis sp.]